MSSAPNWAQIVTACIAFVALIGAVLQLMNARRADRRNAAYRYFERWTDKDAIPYVVKMVEELIKVPPQEVQQRYKAFWEKSQKERLEITLFLNFWEELGGLYNSRLVDRKVVRRYLSPMVVVYWQRADWFVQRNRETNPWFMDQWEQMYHDMERWRNRREHPRPDQRVKRWLHVRRRSSLRHEIARERTANTVARQREEALLAMIEALQEKVPPEVLPARVGPPEPDDAVSPPPATSGDESAP
jgi:hypothetical protein